MGPVVSSNSERIPYTQYTQQAQQIPQAKQEAPAQSQPVALPAAKVSNNYVAPSLTVAEGPNQIKGRPQLGEILNDTYNTLASSPINEDGTTQKKRPSLFGIVKTVAIAGLLFWGGRKLFKAVNHSNAQHSTIEDLVAGVHSFFGDIASRNYTKAEDLKLHLDDIVSASKTRALLPLNLHRATVRVINSDPAETREVVDLVKKIATEARNVRGRTPIITVNLAEKAQAHAEEITKAIQEGKIDTLSDDICKAIEYVRLDYTKAGSNASDYLIDVITSTAQTNGAKAAKGFSKLFNGFWGN